jgi:hypothetical protein
LPGIRSAIALLELLLEFLGFSTLEESLKYSPIETSAVAVIDVSTVARNSPSNILEAQKFSAYMVWFRPLEL